MDLCLAISNKNTKQITTLSAGEIGCALSWHSAWQIISEHRSKACIVLEDDIKIQGNFKIHFPSDEIDKCVSLSLSLFVSLLLT
jgi:GR25 family glycosyltransferase involved in LPS biosynthesis